MKKPLVIFGAADTAQLAHFYFSTDSEYKVVAFVVDPEYVKESSFCGLPLLSSEEVCTAFPPHLNEMFVAISYTKLNDVRKQKYLQAKSWGYALPVMSVRRRPCSTREYRREHFYLGRQYHSAIRDHRNNVTLWSGNHIGHHSRIEDHCFIASHVVVSGRVVVGESCFIGVNATLRDHIKIGSRCVLGAGVLLLSDAEEGGVYRFGLRAERHSQLDVEEDIEGVNIDEMEKAR